MQIHIPSGNPAGNPAGNRSHMTLIADVTQASLFKRPLS
jgi:hypothetical protein